MARKQGNANLGSAVIGLVGTRGPLSRAAIARQLEVSAATITNVTKTLLSQGSLVEVGTRPSGGGRPSILLDVAQQRRYALGVKITANHLTMAEVDINGVPAVGTSIDFDMQAPHALDLITDAICAQVKDRTGLLLGIGLAVPGYSDPSNPDLVSAPTLGWNSVNLGRMLRDRTGLRVVIDNDVNALAVADHLYGDPGARDNLLVTIGYGVGSALSSDGRVHRGAHGAAGEIGHTTVRPTGITCRCGLVDCLETLISDDALVRRAREAGIVDAADGKDELNARAGAGDAAACSLLQDAGRDLGTATANLVHLFDPDTITISGEGVDVWRYWEPGFTQGLRSRLPLARRDIPVTVHPWAEDTWAYGAASLVFALPFR
ncbi:ROK family protein [Propionibacteriaceae bacterium G1746]